MNQNTELIHRAQAGDAHAFALLYQTIYKDLYRFALYTLRHPQDAEDVVSEAVVDAFTGIKELRSPDAFKTWMFRILTAKCNRRIRQYVNSEEELTDAIPQPSADLNQHMDVQRALDTLPPQDRLILSLNLFAGYSSQEIGALLDLNPNTVRSRQSRALSKLEPLLR